MADNSLDRNVSLVPYKPSILAVLHSQIARREAELDRLLQRKRLVEKWHLEDAIWNVLKPRDD